MYILTELLDNGDKKEYTFHTFEEAQALLNKKADADTAAQLGNASCDILRSDHDYSRVNYGSHKNYCLRIEGVNVPKPSFNSIFD